MRQKRAKAYRKQMSAYRLTFKFKPPIQCLVDADSIIEAERTKYDLKKGLDRTIQMETKLFVTQCCINYLYETKNQPAIDICKTMEKRRCGHDETLPCAECIESITNVSGRNKFRYVVVTQNEDLRERLRKIPAVPMIYLRRSVMIMEPMSPASEKVVAMVERKKLVGGLNSVGAGRVEEIADAEKKPKKKKGPKGPNPLSMKKKKVEETAETAETEPKKKRRRKHHKGGEEAVKAAVEAAVEASEVEAAGV